MAVVVLMLLGRSNLDAGAGLDYRSLPQHVVARIVDGQPELGQLRVQQHRQQLVVLKPPKN